MPTFLDDMRTTMWLLFRVRKKNLFVLILFYLLPIAYVFSQTANLISSPFSKEESGYSPKLAQADPKCEDGYDFVIGPSGDMATLFLDDFRKVARRHYPESEVDRLRFKQLTTYEEFEHYITDKKTIGTASAGFYLSRLNGEMDDQAAEASADLTVSKSSRSLIRRIYVYISDKTAGLDLILDSDFSSGSGLPIQLILSEMKVDVSDSQALPPGVYDYPDDLPSDQSAFDIHIKDIASTNYGAVVGGASSYIGINYLLLGIAEAILLSELKAGDKTLYLGLFGLNRHAYILSTALFSLLESSGVLLIQTAELYFLACFGSMAGYGGPTCSGLNLALPILMVLMSIPSVVALCGLWISYCAVSCKTTIGLFMCFLLPTILGTVASMVVSILGALGWGDEWIVILDILGLVLPPVNLSIFLSSAAAVYQVDINSALANAPRLSLGDLITHRLGLGLPSVLEILLISILSVVIWSPVVNHLLRFGGKSGFPRQAASHRPKKLEEKLAMHAGHGTVNSRARRAEAAAQPPPAPTTPALDSGMEKQSALTSDSAQLLVGTDNSAILGASEGVWPQFMLSATLLSVVYPRPPASGLQDASAPGDGDAPLIDRGFDYAARYEMVRKGEHAALRNLTLNLEQGKIYALVGKNGSGKTTFLNLILGLATTVRFREDVRRKIRRLRVWAKRRPADEVAEATEAPEFLYPAEAPQKLYSEVLAVVLQTDIVFSLFTVREQMELMSRVAFGRVAPDRIAEALEEMGLEDCVSQKISNLSGGQRRRLSIAYALLKVRAGASLLLLDEPSCGIDVKSRVYLAQYLFRQRERMAAEGRPFMVLLTTHLLEEAEELADEMIIFTEGQLNAIGSQVFLKRVYTHGYTILIERAANLRGEFIDVVAENSAVLAQENAGLGLEPPQPAIPPEIPLSIREVGEAQAQVQGLDPDSRVSALVSWIARSRQLEYASREIRVPFEKQEQIPGIITTLRTITPPVSFSIQCPSLNDVFLGSQQASSAEGGNAVSLVSEHAWSVAEVCR